MRAIRIKDIVGIEKMQHADDLDVLRDFLPKVSLEKIQHDPLNLLAH